MRMDLLPKNLPLSEPPSHAHVRDEPGTPKILPFALGALVVLVAAFMLVTKTWFVAHASIGAVEGKAQRYAEGTGWVDAQAGDKVIDGTRLRTGAGKLSVLLGDGQALRLDADTAVTVVTLSRALARVDLEQGRAYSRVSDGSAYQVQALDVTVSSAGTAFAVSADPSKRRVGVDVVEHAVDLVANVADGKVEKRLEEGRYALVDLGKGVEGAVRDVAIDPADVRKDPFLGWNVTLDEGTGAEFAWFETFVAPVPAVAAPKPVAKPVVKPIAKPTSTVVTKTDSTKTVTSVKPVSGEMQLKAVNTPDGVNLQWTQSSTSGFQGYKVVRSESNKDPYYPADGYIRFVTDRSNTAFLDTGTRLGTTYYYRICRLAKDAPVACGNVATVVR